MNFVSACFTTSAKTEEKPVKANKFPPRPVKKPVTARATAEDTLKRYPRIMAELAK